MNKELVEALNALEKEKEISKETLFEAIENSLITACKNHFGKADNVKVEINRETGDFLCYAEKEVVATVEEVEDDLLQIFIDDAVKVSKKAKVGDVLKVERGGKDGSEVLIVLGEKETGEIRNCIVFDEKLMKFMLYDATKRNGEWSVGNVDDIISLEINDKTISEISLIIKYINSKGYKIVNLDELLSEDV